MQVKNSKGFPLIGMVLLLSVLLSGCTMLQSQKKVQDLEFTVVRPEEIPETLKEQVESKLEEKFTLTYRDNEYLYIARGYGQQETGGYCITVDQCYLSDNAVCVKTTLTGPQPGEEVSAAPSCPYIVLKLEQRDEEVVFE